VVSLQSSVGIHDAHVTFEQTAEFWRSEIDIPDAVVDLFKADVLANAGRRDVDPLAVLPYAAVGADIAYLEAIGVFE
jgi:hypothetical protein